MIDTKELAKLVKFLRKSGVTKFEDSGLKIELAPEIPKAPRRKKMVEVTSQIHDDIQTDEMSQEDLLFYSAGGVPQELAGD